MGKISFVLFKITQPQTTYYLRVPYKQIVQRTTLRNFKLHKSCLQLKIDFVNVTHHMTRHITHHMTRTEQRQQNAQRQSRRGTPICLASQDRIGAC